MGLQLICIRTTALILCFKLVEYEPQELNRYKH
jgi:hypothetical protein